MLRRISSWIERCEQCGEILVVFSIHSGDWEGDMGWWRTRLGGGTAFSAQNFLSRSPSLCFQCNFLLHQLYRMRMGRLESRQMGPELKTSSHRIVIKAKKKNVEIFGKYHSHRVSLTMMVEDYGGKIGLRDRIKLQLFHFSERKVSRKSCASVRKRANLHWWEKLKIILTFDSMDWSEIW